jgi:hypothetical protein
LVETAGGLPSVTHAEGGLEAVPTKAVGVQTAPVLGLAASAETLTAESNVRLGSLAASEARLGSPTAGAATGELRGTAGAGCAKFTMKQLRNVPIIPEESVLSPAVGFWREDVLAAMTDPS